jgi:hypothetical protein
MFLLRCYSDNSVSTAPAAIKQVPGNGVQAPQGIHAGAEQGFSSAI